MASGKYFTLIKDWGVMVSEFELLVGLYKRAFELRDIADNEAYTGDGALAAGHVITAEQHYSYSYSYRQRSEEKAQEAARLLRAFELTCAEVSLQDLKNRALAQARQCLYGSAEVEKRPLIK